MVVNSGLPREPLLQHKINFITQINKFNVRNNHDDDDNDNRSHFASCDYLRNLRCNIGKHYVSHVHMLLNDITYLLKILKYNGYFYFTK